MSRTPRTGGVGGIGGVGVAGEDGSGAVRLVGLVGATCCNLTHRDLRPDRPGFDPVKLRTITEPVNYRSFHLLVFRLV